MSMALLDYYLPFFFLLRSGGVWAVAFLMEGLHKGLLFPFFCFTISRG